MGGKLEVYPRTSLVAQMVKNLPANAGDPGSIPGSGRSPGEGNAGNPLQYGQWSLADYTPWGWKESDTTEQLSRTKTCVQGWH